MIRFSCPRCRSTLEAPDGSAGGKVNCPKCQQRLQIPIPPRDKTVLATLVPSQPAAAPPSTFAAQVQPAVTTVPVPTPTPAPVPSPAPVPMPVPAGEWPRKRRSTAKLWISGGVGLALPALVVVAVLLVAHANAPPNARCPHCFTPCHINGLESKTLHQKIAIRHRCPTCGRTDDLLDFEAMKDRPHGIGVEDLDKMVVPDR